MPERPRAGLRVLFQENRGKPGRREERKRCRSGARAESGGIGPVTSPVNLPDQCRFMKRCDACMEDCPNRANPQLTEISPEHFVACHMVADQYKIQN